MNERKEKKKLRDCRYDPKLREIEEGLAVMVMLLSYLQPCVGIQICHTVTCMVTETANHDEAEN